MSYCYADPNPMFQPAMRLIDSITQANPAVITTTFAHQYITGTIVRLDIPRADGMQQADQIFGPIIVLSSTTFSMPFDSTNFSPFSVPMSPSPHVDTCAQAVPIGEVNEILAAAVQNVLPF